MRTPFTVEQFLDVFRRYNEEVWPAQALLSALGLAAVLLALRGDRRASRGASAILAALWVWMGAVYHLAYFRAINPAAVVFGVAFLAQGALLAWLGAWHARVTFDVRADAAGAVGGLLVTYALIAYPLLGVALGHRFPASPTFGLPCPTTILTLGLLAWGARDVPRVLLAIPVAWAAVATSAALQLGMREDLGLPAAAVLAVLAVAGPGRRRTVAAHA